MAGEANGAEFEGAAYGLNYDIACGRVPGYYDKPTGALKDWVVGGIFLPEPEKLRAGTTIYRFGDSSKDPARDRFGRWWMARETIELLAARALDAQSLVSIARQHLAVPPSFNVMDMVYAADIRRTLRAFGGVGGLVFQEPPPPEGGKPARAALPGGAELTGTPSDRTMKRQLFIPGLMSVPDALSFRGDLSVSAWLSGHQRGDS